MEDYINGDAVEIAGQEKNLSSQLSEWISAGQDSFAEVKKCAVIELCNELSLGRSCYVWLGRERLFFKSYAERISNSQIQAGCEDLKWFVKSMFDECRDEGKMGKTAGESAFEPQREKCMQGKGNKLVESRKVDRGGLGVTGTQSHHSGYSAAPQSFAFLVTDVEN